MESWRSIYGGDSDQRMNDVIQLVPTPSVFFQLQGGVRPHGGGGRRCGAETMVLSVEKASELIDEGDVRLSVRANALRLGASNALTT